MGRSLSYHAWLCCYVTELHELEDKFSRYENVTTTLPEQGEALLQKQLKFNACVSLCEEQPPDTVNIKKEFEIMEDTSSAEDYAVISPMIRVLETLGPKPYKPRCTAKSSVLKHNCRKHHVDNVLCDGEILAWSTIIMFFEGKITLKGNDLNTAVGQCSQRLFAFMEETKHDHLLSSQPRNIAWACYHDRSHIGFVCRRRDNYTKFPFTWECGNECLEVVFSPEPFQHEGALQEGGKILWRLLRSKEVLGYFGSEVSQPSLCLDKSFRPLHVMPRKRHNATDVTTIIVAADADRINSSPTRSSTSVGATHAVKLFANKEEYDREVAVYGNVGTIANIPNLSDEEVTCTYKDQTYYGFAMTPYGSTLSTTDAKETIQLARHIGSALQELHKKNIIHRDVTPGNIIFFEDKYFLIDFNVTYESHSCYYEEDLAFIGTCHWASKRRQRCNKVTGKYPHPSPLDDWESLFLTLYEVSCGYNKCVWPAVQSFCDGISPKVVSNELSFLEDW